MVKDCIFKEHHHKPIMNASRTRISLKLQNQTRSAMTEAKNKRNRSWNRTWDEKVLQPLEWIFWRPSWKKNSNQKIQTNQIIKHKLINLFIQKHFTSTLDQYRKNSSKFIFLQISTIQSTRIDDITCFAKYLKIHKKGSAKSWPHWAAGNVARQSEYQKGHQQVARNWRRLYRKQIIFSLVQGRNLKFTFRNSEA